MLELYKLNFSAIIKYVKEEDILFWLINIYLFFEYVRPQTLYPDLDVLPFAKMTLILTIILFFLKGKLPSVENIENKLIILFLLVILTSSYNAMSSSIAFDKVPEFISWIIIYYLIINIVNTEERFFIFLLAFLLYSFKMSQFSFFNWVGHGFSFRKDGSGGGPGWFKNSGEFGIQMCIFLALSSSFFYSIKDHLPRWKNRAFLFLPFTALTGTISCSSRGALLGAASIMFVFFLKTKKRFKGIITLSILASIVYLLLPERQLQRFQAAGEDSTSITRIQLWERGLELVDKFPVLGIGYKNWQVAQREIYGLENQLLPHNIFIECAAELGYVGLFVFILMVLFCFINNYRTRRALFQHGLDNKFILYTSNGLDAALVSYLVTGFFVTVLYYPYFWINLSMTVALNNVTNNLVASSKNLLK